jgi:hypothetical protein
MKMGARAIGLLTFLGGLVLLVLVFMAAFQMLQESQAAPGDLQALPREIVILLIRVAMLFVMGYIGSSLAARGIQLFEAAGADETRVVRRVRRAPDDRVVEERVIEEEVVEEPALVEEPAVPAEKAPSRRATD